MLDLTPLHISAPPTSLPVLPPPRPSSAAAPPTEELSSWITRFSLKHVQLQGRLRRDLRAEAILGRALGAAKDTLETRRRERRRRWQEHLARLRQQHQDADDQDVNVSRELAVISDGLVDAFDAEADPLCDCARCALCQKHFRASASSSPGDCYCSSVLRSRTPSPPLSVQEQEMNDSDESRDFDDFLAQVGRAQPASTKKRRLPFQETTASSPAKRSCSPAPLTASG